MKKLIFIVLICICNSLLAQTIAPVVTTGFTNDSHVFEISPIQMKWYFCSNSINIEFEEDIHVITHGFWVTPTKYITPYDEITVYSNYITWKQTFLGHSCTFKYYTFLNHKITKKA